MKLKIAFLTGATGYIGGRLLKRLLADGWVVHVLVRDRAFTYPKAIVHLYDGTTESVVNAILKSNAQAVFHLASLYLTEHQTKDASDLIDSNILLGTQVLEAMTRAGVTQCVLAGTAWQQFSKINTAPVNLYAATKQAFGSIVNYYADAKKIKAITLKIFDTYGPDDSRSKLVNMLIAKAKNGEAIELSPGGQKIHLVHVDDIVNAFILAQHQLELASHAGHQVFCLPSAQPYAITELVQLIEKVGGRPILAKWAARPYRDREVMNPWISDDVLGGWQQSIELQEGIRSLL